MFASDKFYISLQPEKCGEIWLLATTLKNAKILTLVMSMMTAFISMFCVL